MVPGHDGPGRITRQPGGVALNVAYALAREELPVELLSAVGSDPAGEMLIAEISEARIGTKHVVRVTDPTDTYMAIEQADGEVFGAVADCYTLEFAGEDILAPLRKGAFGRGGFAGTAVIDGNLPERILLGLVQSGDLAKARRIYVPASPGKAARLVEVVAQDGGTLFVNRTEASIIAGQDFPDSRSAAIGLAELGTEAIVTDGPNPATLASGGTVLSVTPPDVEVRSVTGAGDAFLAGFVAADLRGEHPAQSLIAAADAAARHISQKAHL